MAFNLYNEETTYTYHKTAELKKAFLANGLLIRPLGNTIYLMPPYCITDDSLEAAYKKITSIIKGL